MCKTFSYSWCVCSRVLRVRRGNTRTDACGLRLENEGELLSEQHPLYTTPGWRGRKQVMHKAVWVAPSVTGRTGAPGHAPFVLDPAWAPFGPEALQRARFAYPFRLQ